MINKSSINDFLIKKQRLQEKLSNLLNSPSKTQEEINEIRAEILYLDKQIERIVGIKEIQMQKELKRKKMGLDDKNLKNYYNFKKLYKKINKFNVSTGKLVSTIESYNNGDLITVVDYDKKPEKVKVA